MADDLSLFVELELAGGRYDHPGMPVETLTELVAYRELVVELAKELWRAKHPARKRVPKGFVDSLQMRIRTVEFGSVVPILERVRADTLLEPVNEFDEARDLLSDTFRAAAAQAPLPASFPADRLELFNRFGRTLQGDERILVRAPGTAPVPYDKDLRRSLVLRGVDRYFEESELFGRVVELDAAQRRFRLLTETGHDVPAPLDDLDLDDVKDVLGSPDIALEVRVQGTVEFDRNQVPQRFESVTEVTALEDLAFERTMARLEEIAELTDGWRDGAGQAPGWDEIGRVRVAVEVLYSRHLPLPRLYPIIDGGIRAEWTFGAVEAVVNFEPDGTDYFFAVDSETGSDIEDENPATGESVAAFVGRVAREGAA